MKRQHLTAELAEYAEDNKKEKEIWTSENIF